MGATNLEYIAHVSASYRYHVLKYIRELEGVGNAKETKVPSAIDEINQIKELAVMEAKLVNKMFSISEVLGLDALTAATTSFEQFLRRKDKMFISGMSIEYRTFVIELIELIDEPYRDTAIAKFVIG